ncbi:hypothetical protein DUNSADRAFT_13967 [Dunaliella salina]|uniref:Encoded protein n=1 Tax=Dunaliella salina TaxID=3046 RepID=A0ABQ7G8B7_DUNSA|nr:hypothetical protein DUNSADRAFT_13967 [Dunaliella salina]|eukprot:KAF5830844.1 hypothetical protein DUNSADRAFT_13967 [Dunaliella salina]
MAFKAGNERLTTTSIGGAHCSICLTFFLQESTWFLISLPLSKGTMTKVPRIYEQWRHGVSGLRPWQQLLTNRYMARLFSFKMVLQFVTASSDAPNAQQLAATAPEQA